MSVSRQDVHKLIDRHVAAWNAASPQGVAASYSADATFVINRGDPMIGRAAIAEMVAGFATEFPDMSLSCDHRFIAGDHAVYVWTFKGHQKDSGARVDFQGWEEWTLNAECEVTSSLGWYDQEEYERQLAAV